MLTKKLNYILNETPKSHDIFFEFERERVEWEPQAVKQDYTFPYQKAIEACFSRCISLSLQLELPVGSFISAIVEESKIPITAKQGLIKNILDEEKHEKAFRRISECFKCNEEDKIQANKYRIACVQHKVNPLIKSRDLETIVFIPLQSVLRYYSGSESLERVIGFISRDEYRHLNYNWEVSCILDIGFNSDFESLLTSINKWLFEPLKDVPLDYNFWMNCTSDMLEQGKSKKLEDLFHYGIHLAPFEISNSYY